MVKILKSQDQVTPQCDQSSFFFFQSPPLLFKSSYNFFFFKLSFTIFLIEWKHQNILFTVVPMKFWGIFEGKNRYKYKRPKGSLLEMYCVFHHISGQFQSQICIGKFQQKLGIRSDPHPTLLKTKSKLLPFFFFRRLSKSTLWLSMQLFFQRQYLSCKSLLCKCLFANLCLQICVCKSL